jgi:hypothetical protein
MKNYKIFALLALGFSSPPLQAQSSGSICIDGRYLVSSESRQIEIFDVNANRQVGTFTMTGSQKTYGINVMINGSGYINIRYRNATNNGSWIGSSFMKDGDCVSP